MVHLSLKIQKIYRKQLFEKGSMDIQWRFVNSFKNLQADTSRKEFWNAISDHMVSRTYKYKMQNLTEEERSNLLPKFSIIQLYQCRRIK